MERAHGFTLIELAVAIFIITLLLGGILVPLSMQVERKQISDTQKTLDEIKEALAGFAIANGYLSCPDINNDGLEDVSLSGPTNGKCSSSSGSIAAGNLPWQTLGVANADVWGNRFRYVINERYAWRSPATPVTLSGGGTGVRVCTAASSCAGSALTSSAVAAILSLGKNGYGATSSITGTTNPNPASADEIENTDNNRDVVSRTITAPGTPAGEFDDIVTWLPSYVLFNRMVAAGKLP